MVVKIGNLLAITMVGVMLYGCGEEEAAVKPPPIRAIKYMELSSGVQNQQRRIAGIVTAGTSSAVAFETSGQVIALLKDVGDHVDGSELIARLDPEPFELRVQETESKLGQAKAALADRSSKYRQQAQLFKKGYTTRTNYESALADLRNAEGSIGIAESQLKIAKRDLVKTELRAPFPGVIARKEVDDFEEVTSGQVVYQLQTEGEFEVKISLPETLVTAVSLGDRVGVAVNLLGPDPIPGRITEIAPLAEDVNAYPVTVLLEDTPENLRVSMSAQVILEFASEASSDAFTVPIAALSPLAGEEGGLVYVFNDGTLSARKVRVVGLRDNSLQVIGDVADGDVIATAGVSLLHDGMQARLLDPAVLR